MLSTRDFLDSVTDIEIFEETARRLKRRYREDRGESLSFGSFEFIFDDGIFEGIDENQRTIFYQNPRKLRLVPKN